MNYDEDLYQWTMDQARALRDRATTALDYDNLAEEIESLGRSDKREIESRLRRPQPISESRTRGGFRGLAAGCRSLG